MSSGLPAKWQVRVNQIEANNPSKAPADCAQYFTGTEGSLTSLNFDTTTEVGSNIHGLKYAACFRKESGYCSIAFTPVSLRSRRHAHYQQGNYQQGGYQQGNYQQGTNQLGNYHQHANYQPYQYPLTKGYVSQKYVRPIQTYVLQSIRPAHVYRYPLVAVNPQATLEPYRPPYQSPFDNSGSAYIPPLAAGGSTVVLNTSEASVPINPINSLPITDAPSTDDTTVAPVDSGSSTDSGNSTDTGYVAPISDRAQTCENSDSIGFLPTEVVCAAVGARPVSINVVPYIVYVDNRGTKPSKGFHYTFAHAPC